ncbi:hypothetical protein F4779DRAFT_588198 [Xylariaceae sp. FL0662B]|nr:hypothetical protein F4779DRAFT_588198 [Xylariaceae sp. FL0662B]
MTMSQESTLSSIPVVESQPQDVHTSIKEWQAEGQHIDNSDDKSLVVRLCDSIIELLKHIAYEISRRDDVPKNVRTSLERSRGFIVLWYDDYEIRDGKLDDVFAKSRNLCKSTLKILACIADTASNRLIPLLGLFPEPLDALLLKTKAICAEAIYVTHDEAGSDSDCSSQFSLDFETDNIGEVAEDLKTDVQCLMDLGPLLKNPVLDPPSPGQNDIVIRWEPQEAYCDKVAQRFPSAEQSLVKKLGEVNLARYLRCQEERSKRENEFAVYEMAKETSGTIANSKFQDSGLGTSIPASSSYAETVMTYNGIDGQKTRIPPIPDEGKNGKRFPCVACGRMVTIRTNSAWKRHLYLDLQPYVCLDTSCSNAIFDTRNDWIAHLALDHGLEPLWPTIECPLCLESTGEGKVAIISHLANHLEEISLSALPSHPDDELSEGSSMPTSSHDSDDDVVRCVCGFEEAPLTGNAELDGVQIQCEICDVWQHAVCVGIKPNNEAYICEICRSDQSRPLIMGATSIDYKPPKTDFYSSAGSTMSIHLRSHGRHEADIDSDEPRYCYCNGVSYGEMVACDNDKCKAEWFHLKCTGLPAMPNPAIKWFCRNCENVETTLPKEGQSTTGTPSKPPRRIRSGRPKVKRGCDNCMLRRIKCDEKRPECSQCVRTKKQCTGYSYRSHRIPQPIEMSDKQPLNSKDPV